MAVGGLQGALKPGDNRLTLKLGGSPSEGFEAGDADSEGKGGAAPPGPGTLMSNTRSPIPPMPYLLTVSYRCAEPEPSDACPLRLSAKLAASTLRRGRTVALNAELANASDEDQPAAVVVLGLPAGLEPRPEQLDGLKKAGTIGFYKVRPRKLVLYWRRLVAKRRIELKLDLEAAVVGKYVGPPSSAYLNGEPGSKRWCEPLTVEITRN